MKKLIGLVVVLVLLLIVALQPNIKKQNEYTVVYYVGRTADQIPSLIVQQNGKAFKPADPYRADAEFGGWYLTRFPEEEDEEFDFKNEKITSSITLYAKWIFDNYTIEYDLNGGYWPADPYQGSFLASDSQVFLKPASSATHPKHDSFGRFQGWRTISQEEYNKLTTQEQKDYPYITSFKPDDPSTLTAFDENKHVVLYAHYRNFPNP